MLWCNVRRPGPFELSDRNPHPDRFLAFAKPLEVILHWAENWFACCLMPWKRLSKVTWSYKKQKLKPLVCSNQGAASMVLHPFSVSLLLDWRWQWQLQKESFTKKAQPRLTEMGFAEDVALWQRLSDTSRTRRPESHGLGPLVDAAISWGLQQISHTWKTSQRPWVFQKLEAWSSWRSAFVSHLQAYKTGEHRRLTAGGSNPDRIPVGSVGSGMKSCYVLTMQATASFVCTKIDNFWIDVEKFLNIALGSRHCVQSPGSFLCIVPKVI